MFVLELAANGRARRIRAIAIQPFLLSVSPANNLINNSEVTPEAINPTITADDKPPKFSTESL